MQNKLWFIFISEMQPTKKNAVFLACVGNNDYLCIVITIAMEEKRYPELNEEQGIDMCCEPALATAELAEPVLPSDMSYAHIVDGVLQITSDIEDEIAEVERGETVSLSEFNTMFAKWLD